VLLALLAPALLNVDAKGGEWRPSQVVASRITLDMM
jgi:hypothetical protein